MASTTKRKYTRRTEEERIAELEKRIKDIQARVQAKKRRDSPVLKEIPKIKRKLKQFAQLAQDHGRADVANSTMAFMTSLDRVSEPEEQLVDWTVVAEEDDEE